MKILHVPFCFAPDPVGGTEIYVAALASDLMRRGVETVIAAPGAETRAYEIEGLQVRRFETSQIVENVSELYGDGDPLAAEEFANLLENEKPDIVHLHAFTRAVSSRVVLACKHRRVPIVFTYHTPTVSCQRGTMMLWGQSQCDGRLDLRRCTACTLQGLGLPRTIAKVASLVSSNLRDRIDLRGLEGRLWTALRMSELISLRHSAFFKLVQEVDHFVAVCSWVRDVILANGVEPNKVSLCRHGVSVPDTHTESRAAYQPNGRSGQGPRFVFVGRFDPTKGLDIVIDAFRQLPSLHMSLDVFGIAQSASSRSYERRVKALAESDTRIIFHPALPKEEVIGRLSNYDFLLVPSLWMETGPLVVLEAFAAGTPVIGNRIGGIAELVRDQVDGLLVDSVSDLAWRNTLRMVAEDAHLCSRLKAGIRNPRTTSNVADEMLALYESLLAARPHQSPNISAVA